ncbi:MAG: HEPN domain-containing protein [Rhodovibrio sp.]|nr:HEPN domain-containing protein [Rhodovibrio sp.]
MNAEASSHRHKARRLTGECDHLSPDEAPVALISTSYYAIYHACVAALLSAHGTAPGKHGKVHRAIAELAAKLEGEARAQEVESAIEDAYEMRVRADYEPDGRPEETRRNAERIPALRDTVIAFCDRVIAGA